MPLDRSVLPDERDEFSGWVELYNRGTNAVSLGGYGLSDDAAKPFRWRLPPVSIPPGGIQVVFLSGEDRMVPEAAPGEIPPSGSKSPEQLPGLSWWLDASDAGTVTVTNERVVRWADKAIGSSQTNDVGTRFVDPATVEGKCLWLDASNTNSVKTLGGAVSEWIDQSGAGASAIQMSAALRPRWISLESTQLRVLRFDGMDDVLRLPHLAGIYTIFWVGRELEFKPYENRPLLGNDNTAELARGNFGEIIGPFPEVNQGAAQGQVRLDRQTVKQTEKILPSGIHLVSIVSGLPVAVDSIASERNIPGRVWNGDVAEILCFKRFLSAAEMDGIENYLMKKWLGKDPEPLELPDATQGIVDMQPVRTTDAQTGKHVISFDGVNDFLEMPVVRDVSTLVCVVRESPEASDAFRPVVGHRRIETFQRGANGALSFNGLPTRLDGVQVANSRLTALPGGWHVWETANLAETYVQLVGAERPEIAIDRYWHGKVAEIIGYKRSLDPSEAESLNQYLRWKWRIPKGAIHAGFKIKAAGGTLNLTRPDGGLADRITVPAGRANVSFGRTGTGSTQGWQSVPSPGRVNPEGPLLGGIVPSPSLTSMGGVFSGFLLVNVLWNALPADTVVRYTTDGTEPTETSSVASPAGWGLAKSTVLRLKAWKTGWASSETATAHFIVRATNALPIVSLATSPSNLFDVQWGLYVPGNATSVVRPSWNQNWDHDWERPVSVQFFPGAGEPGFLADAGLRIHGSFTRRFPQKSLRLHFRKRYGAGELDYPMFPQSRVEEFDSLILRNGGNDWTGTPGTNSYGTLYRDALGHAIAGGMGLDRQEWRPAEVFINGEYWGIHEIRERLDHEHLARHHGLDPDDLDVLKNEQDVVAGTSDVGVEWRNRVMTSGPARPLTMVEIESQMDVDNHLDWLVLELFADNGDWPGNNVLTWRSRTGMPLWRWAIADLDGGFTPADQYFDPLQRDRMDRLFLDPLPEGVEGRYVLFVRKLLVVPEWKERFIRRFSDRLSSDLLPENTLRLEKEIGERLAPAIPSHLNRWSGPFEGYSTVASLDHWQTNRAGIQRFLRERPEQIRAKLSQIFGLTNWHPVTLASQNTNQGFVLVNSLPPADTQTGWKGEYPDTVSIQIVAVANPGFVFRSWSDGDRTGAGDLVSERRLTPQAPVVLTASFDVDPATSVANGVAIHDLSFRDYRMEQWPADAAPGEYPPALLFRTSSSRDPGVTGPWDGFWTNRYDLTSRSRIVGRGEQGLAFINTSDPQAGSGYLGVAELSLGTRSVGSLAVSFVAGTSTSTSRTNSLRLQWRRGETSEFQDVVRPNGRPVEYTRNAAAGHRERFGPIRLPDAMADQPLVQLRWVYVLAGGDDGPRSELLLDDIVVSGVRTVETATLQAIRTGANGLRLIANVVPQSVWSLFVSSNLVDWTRIESMVAGADGRITIEEVSLNDSARFYQLRKLE